MPSWASSWTADMPFECVAMRCAAQNHTVSGNFDRCIAVPAVIDVWRPQPRHSWVCARLFNNAARLPPQAGQTKPSGQRRSNRNAAQLVSSGKLAWNSLRDRALAIAGLLAPAACGRPRGHYTTYRATWDNGISFVFILVRTDHSERFLLVRGVTPCKFVVA